MSDLLIKGMEMPKNCERCPIREGTFCDIISKDIDRFYGGSVRRDKDCPLVEVPKHGRLIDADKIPYFASNPWKAIATKSEIENMPTVIEASEE